MLMRRYEMPWRRAYESYAGVAWLMAAAYFATTGAIGQLPRPLALPLALLCFGMGVLRIAQSVRVSAGQEPPLFAGEVAVLMRDGCGRTVPAGLGCL